MPQISSLTSGGATDFSSNPASSNETDPIDLSHGGGPSVQGAVQSSRSDPFEWNLGKLYGHQEGHSPERTWTVRILSTVLVLPLVLTLILDLGRRVAFAVGLIDGKSWSLFGASSGGKAAGQKAEAAYQHRAAQEEISRLNRKSERDIQGLAKKLVDGYNSLNGGYFHTNNSFSSPGALSAEKQIGKAQRELCSQMKEYVIRNASGTKDFATHLHAVQEIVDNQIYQAAGDSIYIPNKVVRLGPQPSLHHVALQEFANAEKRINQFPLADHFIRLASQEPDFSEGLAKGIELGILTPEQAKSGVMSGAQSTFKEGLEVGLEAACRGSEDLLASAIQKRVVTQDEAIAIDDAIQFPVEKLAEAAALDMLQKQNSATTEIEELHHLSKMAKDLKKRKKLDPQNESRFLTLAKAGLDQGKEAAVQGVLKAQKENEELEAQKIAEIQKAADQTSLLGKFIGFLSLIKKKQKALFERLPLFGELAKTRQKITDQLEVASKAKVTVMGQEMTVLLAAAEYYKAVTKISKNSSLTHSEKHQKIKDLADHGFTRQTMDKINELNRLEPELKKVMEEMDALSASIDAQYSELSKLHVIYKVFRKHNLGGLESLNRKKVEGNEKEVNGFQKIVDQKHSHLLHNDRRFRTDPYKLVNIDPAANREEVEALLKADENGPEEPSSAPVSSSISQKLWDGTKYCSYAATYPIRAPYNAFASWWHRV